MRAIFPKTMTTLRDRLADSRSKRVIFVSHCLLNENARYMGGACCAGANPEALGFLSKLPAGIIQMPCPERISWGGVYKKHVYQFHGIGRIAALHTVCAFTMPLFLFLVNWRIRKVARKTAEEIEDYLSNGMDVIGVIGIRGSPTCAVTRHPDLRCYFDWSSRIDPKAVTTAEQNAVLARVAVSGPGFLMARLRRELHRRGICVPFFEFDLYDELDGKPNSGLTAAAAGIAAALAVEPRTEVAAQAGAH